MNNELRPHIEDLKSEDIPRQVDAARAVESFGKDAVLPLIELLDHPNDACRVYAGMALTGLHQHSSEPLAKTVLDGKSTSLRAMAAWALMLINTPILAKTFFTAFELRDWTVVSQASWFFIAQGRQGSESVLIEALRQTNSKKLALDFCRCGNDSLEQASAAWARGQAIVEWPDEPLQLGRPQWGQAPAMYPWFNPKSRHPLFS